MVRPSSVGPDKVQKCIKCLKNWQDMKVPEAMKLKNFSVKEVADLYLRTFIKQSLPGKTLKGLKAHALGSLLPPLPQPDCAERRLNRAINDKGAVVEPGSHKCTIAVTLSPLLPRPPPAATPQSKLSSSDALTALAALTTATSTMAVNKQKSWNHTCYAKNKICLLDFDDAAATAATAVATTDSAAAVAAVINEQLLNFKPDAAAANATAVFTTEQCRRHGHRHRRTLDYCRRCRSS